MPHAGSGPDAVLSPTRRLVLASGSPRRALLLSAAGFEFDVILPDVDERRVGAESAAEMVMRLAEAKSAAVNLTAVGETVVLAADTVVVVDDAVLGKPPSEEDAIAMVRTLVGRSHHVLTGWAIRCSKDERFGVATSQVVFRPRTDEEVADYVRSTNPYDKAGGYAIQGDDGWLIDRVIGSRANVMGLPIGEVVPALEDMGVPRISGSDLLNP